MTSTFAPPPPSADTPPRQSMSDMPMRSERRRAEPRDSGSARTVRAATATALGILPLISLFTDIRWLVDVFAAIAIVGGTAALARCWQRPHVWHTWLGVLLLVPWLTWRFVPDHALGHIIATGSTLQDISHLLNHVRDTTSNGVAPVAADRPITLVLAAVAGLLAAFVDLVAVVGRRPALAGVPLLVVFTVAGAVRRHPVSWVWFCASAVAFLLLLSIDARDEVRSWGRLIPRAGESRPSTGLAVSGPRIAFIAVALAVVLPLLVPARTSNLLADAFHNGGSGTGGPGTIGAGGVSLNPFAALRGELVQSKPTNLFTVTVQNAPVAPFYLRANVLDTYTDAGWSVQGHGPKLDVNAGNFSTQPDTPQLNTVNYVAHIYVSGLSDNPPVFANPTSIGGVDTSTGWSPTDQLLIGSQVNKHQVIDENVSQPNPTIADLSAATDPYPKFITDNYVGRPTSLPSQVTNLVSQLTKGKTTAYAKARAINDYFISPANGFAYSLQTKPGDSGSALVDFLTNRSGFCQQFAAAMGIMLRVAGVPSRVVLGYTHPALNLNSAFTVTTSNAHAWVEVFFTGIGWVPFDPTPITPAAGAATADVPWAPHPAAAGNPQDTRPAPRPSASGPRPSPQSTGGQAGSPTGSTTATRIPWSLLWTVAAFLFVASIGSVPALVRWRRRRQRLRAAGSGNPDPLWAELSDTAVDLGYVWSASRTPRQVVSWLSSDVGPQTAQSLRDLAAAVEQSRYAPAPVHGDSAAVASVRVSELKAIEARLREHRSRSTRIRSRLMPSSLTWLPRLRPGARRRL